MERTTRFYQNILCYLFAVIIFGILINPVEGAANSYSLLPFQMKDQYIKGIIKPNSNAKIQLDHRLIQVNSDADGKFIYNLKQSIGDQEIVLFLKDSKGFEQKTIRQYASDSEKSINGMIAPTFLGIRDDQFVLKTAYPNSVVASYEGKTYSSMGTLRIPKKQSNEIKFLSRSPESLSSKMITRQVTQNAKIKLSAFDFSGSTVSGIAWPLTMIELLDEEGVVRANADTDKDGKFTLHIQLSEEELSKKTNWIIQDKTEGLPFDKQHFSIDIFTASEDRPSYFYYDDSKSKVIVKTFSDADVQIDQTNCQRLENSGMFHCPVTMTYDPTHQVEVHRNGKVIEKNAIQRSFKNEEFPFQLNQPLAATNARLSGTTLPEKQFRLVLGNGLNLDFDSNSSGRFDISLPATYQSGYQLYVKGEHDNYHFLRYVEVKDDRVIPKPTFKIRGGDWYIYNTLQDAELRGELWIEKANGTVITKVVSFEPTGKDSTTSGSYATILGMENGDRYTLTLINRGINDNSVVLKGTFKRMQIPSIDYTKSDSLVLVGKTTPNAKVSLSIPVFYRINFYTTFKNIEVQADSKGSFKATLKEKNQERIDYTGTLESTVTSPNKSDYDNYSIRLIDRTSPRIELELGFLADYETSLTLKADDRLSQLEIQYYTNQKLVSQKTIAPVKKLDIPYSKNGRTSYQSAGITSIKVRAMNRSQKLSEWTTFQVKNTEFANVQWSKIYVGDKTIKGKSSTNEMLEWVVNNTTYKVKPTKSGSFQVKLKKPIQKGTRTVKLVLKNEIGEKESKNIKVDKH